MSIVETPADRLEPAVRLPAPPARPGRPPFPVLACIAPVVMSLVMFALTKSPVMLAFAAFGPVLAVAGVIDGRRQQRRARRAALDEHEGALDEAEREIEGQLTRALRRTRARTPLVCDLLAAPAWGNGEPPSGAAGPFVGTPLASPAGGAPSSERSARLTLGASTLLSGIVLEGGRGEGTERARALVERAQRLGGAPFTADAGLVVVRGRSAAAAGHVRALVMHAVNGGARRVRVELGETAGVLGDAGGIAVPSRASGRPATRSAVGDVVEVVRRGEHRLERGAPGSSAPGRRTGTANDLARIRILGEEADAELDGLEPARAIVVTVESSSSAVVRDSLGETTRIVPDIVSLAALEGWLAGRAVAAGRPVASPHGAAAPPSLDALLADARAQRPATAGAPCSLRAVLGTGPRGAVEVDLVRDGPHAVLVGTTGSGKSRLLLSWLALLAASYGHDALQFLFIDAKGGAALDRLSGLPHCLGVVTDLEEDAPFRAVRSLRAEIARREREVRAAGAEDVGGVAGAFARLVVVIDEFQLVVGEHPTLHDDFADLAARGRSLGIHLVVCTQTASGALRERLLANIGVRVCLRVANALDSRALLGGDAAVGVPASEPGRGFASIGGALAEFRAPDAPRETLERFVDEERARARDALLPCEDAGRAGADVLGARSRRPWREPLPERLDAHALAALADDGPEPGRADIALADDPDRGRQLRAGVRIAAGARLLVIGGAGSGRSTTLDALGEAIEREGLRVCRVPRDLEGAWDAVHELAGIRFGTHRDAPGEAVLIDDLDVIAASLDDEHRAQWLERVAALARGGRAGAPMLAWSTRRLATGLTALHSLSSSVLVLGGTSPADASVLGVRAGGSGRVLPPGRGVLAGFEVQVVAPASRPAPSDGRSDLEREFVSPGSHGLAVVTRRPVQRRELAARLGWPLERVGAGAPSAQGGPGAASGTTLSVAGVAGVRIGDPEEWAAAYGLLPRLAERMPVVLDGLSPGETRALLRGSAIPPPVADPQRTAVVRRPEGSYERARWPEPA